MNWCCPHCGAGQVLQLEVGPVARTADLRSILGGMALRNKMRSGIEKYQGDILDGPGGI
jgi:hypothetical protein